MTEHDSRWLYRQMIDAMVVACLQGPGRVSAERIRIGVWNPNADADTDPNQVLMNGLLSSMEETHRQALSALFAEEFASGIFNALSVLTAAHLQPFHEGYEGDPSDDFLGRIDGSQWPGDAR
jgi:hypothetical protein